MMKILFFSFSILFFTNCVSNKQTSSLRDRTDSLRHTTSLFLQTTTVPASHARLNLPLAAIKELPAQAAFIQKSGQATAEIRFLHDTLFVTAACDSLQSLLYRYEEQIEKLSVNNEQQKQESKKKTLWPASVFLIVLLGGIYFLFSSRF